MFKAMLLLPGYCCPAAITALQLCPVGSLTVQPSPTFHGFAATHTFFVPAGGAGSVSV